MTRVARSGARIAAAALASAALLLTGCSADEPVEKVARQQSKPSASAAPKQTAATRAAAAKLVGRLGLAEDDVASGFKVKLIRGGDRVEGEVTLHNCGYRFTTEKHRVARRQVDLVHPAGHRVGAQSEVVAHDTEARAARAMDELRASFAECRRGVYYDSPERMPDVRYLSFSSALDGTLPAKDNLVAQATISVRGRAGKAYGVQTYQRHGRVLSAVYVLAGQPFKQRDLGIVRLLAETTGKRLVEAKG